jgi:uncharacterized protein YukE
MANEVDMKVPEVQKMAKSLDTIHTVLDTCAKTLQFISLALKSNIFTGLVGAAAIVWIDNYRPKIQDMADKCEKLSDAVNKSVEAFQNGDTAASNLFMTGL